jgi:hypothetical protein
MEAELTCETCLNCKSMDEDKKKETVSEYNTPLSKPYRPEINFD